MDADQIKSIGAWYDNNYKLYEQFCIQVKDIIERLIKLKKIPYQSISCRVKEKDSFVAKCQKDKYSNSKNPIDNIMDIAGVRIIAYINSDVNSICNLIEHEFNIDSNNSMNKANVMEDNQVGYLSVHYIAKLNRERARLTEYEQYKNMRCEIQIRTLLQHAWAEIEHDRNYKFGGVLPKEIKRRFFLAAGTLEMVDREFQSLSEDIDSYSKEVNKKASNGDLDICIDSTSLLEYMKKRFNAKWIKPTFNNADAIVIKELMCFGINTLSDLDKLIPSDYIDFCSSIGTADDNFLGILRDIMIINDYQKYFGKCKEDDWKSIDTRTRKVYKHYQVPVDSMLDEYNIRLYG